MQIVHCTNAQLDVLSELFNDYRIFYKHESDVLACRNFIAQNIEQRRSKIFLLLSDEGKPLAFSQLYPAVCSLALRPYYYLSDLYVVASERKKGHARHLMGYLTEHFAQLGAQRLTLDTATTNKAAQCLYESLGYVREDVYITYHQTLG
ncbi:MAG: GNAT family N-acetyltransferase [Hydrogenophaga sp.]|uniref:GNAT family N-acetyltransferase n=1 Tax=Hydrogenophaga sp. TaxID=1904254 RepID=UPI0025BF6DD5|nr:GNAT family N-acetyltransferase [Hydrogenophaga sp.]MBU7575384.1 GNAT family N-acetyltransferase [Hydrogenophaga sp.]